MFISTYFTPLLEAGGLDGWTSSPVSSVRGSWKQVGAAAWQAAASKAPGLLPCSWKPMEMIPWAGVFPEGKASPGRFRHCLHVMYSQGIKATSMGTWKLWLHPWVSRRSRVPLLCTGNGSRRCRSSQALPMARGSWRSSVAPCGCSQPGRQPGECVFPTSAETQETTKRQSLLGPGTHARCGSDFPIQPPQSD